VFIWNLNIDAPFVLAGMTKTMTDEGLEYSHATNYFGPFLLTNLLLGRLFLKHKSGRGPSNEHLWQVWLKSVQRFQRRRVKCEKLTDGRTTDAYPWLKNRYNLKYHNTLMREVSEDSFQCIICIKKSLQNYNKL
jgi:hypothetical protein